MEQDNDVVGYRDKSTVIKQGYLVKCQRGLVKAPKMRYFVLTHKGLIYYTSKPDESTVNQPLAFLSFKQLTAVKLDEIELNHCTLPCLQITSRTISSFLLAFSQKEERDEWMMAMLTAYSETLVSSRSLTPLAKATKPTLNTVGDHYVTTAVGHLQGILTNVEGSSLSCKRRKTNRDDSLRRSKSYDDHLNDCTTTTNVFNIEVDTTARQATSRKRKSMPDVHVITHDFPVVSWNNNEFGDEKEFKSNCFEHRDSLTLLSAQKPCTKCDAKTSFVSKIMSMLEHSTRRRLYSLRN